MNIRQPLSSLSEEEYNSLRSTGLLYVLYPKATGNHSDDAIRVNMGSFKEETGQLVTPASLPPTAGPTPDYYNKIYKGYIVDPYVIAELYGITDHAQFQALKKLLRAGADHKDYKRDLEEARDAIDRKLEMLQQDGD